MAAIRWLVVGGGAAGRTHLRALAETDGAEVVGLVSSHATEVDQPVPVARTLDAALERWRPDAVVVATRHDRHTAEVRACLDAGAAVLCEKPVGRTVDESRALLSHAEAIGGNLGVVLNQRAHAHARWLRQQVGDGTLRPTAITVTGHLHRLSGWHADRERSGGGVLRTIGIHQLDLVRWWLGGAEVVAASTWGEGEVEDVAHVLLRGAGGVPVVVALSATGTTTMAPIRVVVDAVGARVVVEGGRAVACEGIEPPDVDDPPADGLRFGPGHRVVAAESTAALRRGDAFPVTLAEALPSLALVDAAYDLSRSSA